MSIFDLIMLITDLKQNITIFLAKNDFRAFSWKIAIWGGGNFFNSNFFVETTKKFK